MAVGALLLSSFLPRIAFAQMHEHVKECDMMEHGGMMGGMGVPLLLRGADLTPAQETKVRQILEQNHAKSHDQFEQIHAAREAIATKLMSSGQVTASDLSGETQKIANAQQQILQNELNMALQVRAVLTPAQLQKIAKLHQKFESLREQMRALVGPPPSNGPPPPDAPPPT